MEVRLKRLFVMICCIFSVMCIAFACQNKTDEQKPGVQAQTQTASTTIASDEGKNTLFSKCYEHDWVGHFVDKTDEPVDSKLIYQVKITLKENKALITGVDDSHDFDTPPNTLDLEPKAAFSVTFDCSYSQSCVIFYNPTWIYKTGKVETDKLLKSIDSFTLAYYESNQNAPNNHAFLNETALTPVPGLLRSNNVLSGYSFTKTGRPSYWTSVALLNSTLDDPSEYYPAWEDHYKPEDLMRIYSYSTESSDGWASHCITYFDDKGIEYIRVFENPVFPL